MHILIIPSEEYIPSHKPIAGIFQHDQAKILKEKGNKVGVLSFSFSYSLFSLIKSLLGKKNKLTTSLRFVQNLKIILQKVFIPKKSSILYENIDEINILRCDGFWGTTNSLKDLSLYNLWIKYGEYAFNTYLKKYGKPDLIHAHNLIYAGLLASCIKQKYNIPIVITEHSSQYAMESISSTLTHKIKKVLNTELAVFAVSPKLIKLLSSKFITTNNRIRWLPNVLDPMIEDISFLNKTKTKTVRFLNVANLIPLKGQEELIRAFATSFRGIENVELIIAGEGLLKASLQQLITELNLTEKVKLIGFIDRKEVVRQIDLCSIFVLPSHYETFGVVLIEALSRGIPVISTYCGGPECIVNKDNGLLVQAKSVTELATALKEMYNNHLLYDAPTLRKNLINTYGKKAFYQKIITIYKEVTSI